MLFSSWSDVVRSWFSKAVPTKLLSRTASRRPLRSKSQHQIEHLEDRCLLSAISIDDVTVTEGDAGTVNAVFTISLDVSDAAPITVLASTADNTATAPADYTAQVATLVTFAPGVTTQTFTVVVNGDTLDEIDETFFVNLTGETGNATVADAQGVGTITDDDATPSLSIDDITVIEGDAGIVNAVFTITLSAASGQTVTVNAATADLTAISPGDYTAVPSTLITFAPGVTTQTFTVAVNGDTLDELNELYLVNLTGPTNATILDPQGVGTITDDDATPSLSIDDVTVVEGDAGIVNAVFTITLSAASGQTVTVNAATADFTAVSPGDYTAVPSTLITFAPGVTTQTFTVAVNGDTLDELNELYLVNLTGPTNATILDPQGLGTITDDDPTPTLTIDDVTVVEGDAGITNAVFTITLSAASGQTVTVNAASADGSATAPGDYTALLSTLVTFAPGVTTQTVTVPVNGDTLDETNEVFLVNLSGAANATIADAQGVGTITDDDATPTLSIDDVTVVEGDAGITNAVFTITLSAASGQTVTVNAATADFTAISPGDYTAVPSTLVTFAPGVTTQTVTVAVNGDTLDELDEAFFVNLSGATNATLSDPQGVGTITDDDLPPTVTLSVAPLTMNEAAGQSTVTAILSAVSGLPTTITLGFSGTATNITDYTRSGTQIVIPAGQLTGTVILTAVQDVLFEGNETVIVDITAVTNGTENGIQQATATILDDDTAPTVSLSVLPQTMAEAAGQSTVTATLSAVSGLDTTVTLGFSGTATDILDYTSSGIQIVIPAGQLTGTVILTAVQDLLFEGDETVIVDITAVINGTENGVQQVTATILDDDTAPTVDLTLLPLTMVEAAGQSTVTATLSAVSGLPTTVTLGFSGTATDLLDYTSSGIQIVIPAGQLTGTVILTAVQDLLFEGDETVIVDITAVTNGTENGAQQVTATILDDDTAPTVSLSVLPLTMAEAAGQSTVTTTLSAVSGLPTTVTLGFSGTATDLLDYTSSGIQIVIPAGQLTGTVILTAVQDLLFEGDETVIVDIAAVVNGTENGVQQVTATIIDDDTAPTVTLSVLPLTMAEAAGQSTVTATLSAVSGLPTTVTLGFSGTATDLLDYTSSGIQIVIPAGQLTGTVILTAVQDLLFEGDETVLVDITGVINGTENGVQQVTATIIDDDAAPAVTLALLPLIMAEAAGQSTVTATLSAVSGLPTTVTLGFSGTATDILDYTSSGIQIVIPAGQLTGTVILTAVQDLLFEGDETVIVDITAVTNGTENGVQQVTATIIDDDTAPTVSLSVLPLTMAEAAGQSTVTATLSAVSGLPTTVSLAFSGTATDILDYTSSGIQIVIPAGQLTGTVILTAVQDLLFEGDETVIVDITAVVNGTENGVQQVTATIIDDDTAPTVDLSVAPLTMAEAAGQSTVTATLSAVSGLDTTVTLGFSGTATNLTDYTRSGTQIVIPAGQLTGSITLNAVQDLLYEGSETIITDITGVINGTENGVQQATATIIDDDALPTVTLTLVPPTMAEAAGQSTVTATLSAVSGLDTTVTLGFSGSATNIADYTRSGTQIVIPAGQLTGTITLDAVQDFVFDGVETVIVDITAVTNGAENGVQQVTATIVDDETATVSIATITNGAEANTPTNGLFRVTLSSASPTDTVVTYSIAGTATPGAGQDYATLSGTVTIPAGQLSADIVVTVFNDSNIEDTETVTVSLTGFGAHDPGVILSATPANLTATVSISDDEPLIITSPATASVAENTPATTVVLNVDANPVAGHVLTYSLSGPDVAAFTIDPVTGEIRFVTSPNFEAPTDQGADNIYNITVSVTVDFNPTRTTTQDLTITVTPVNDNAPQFVDASPTFSISEGSSAGTAVGAVSATDADLPADSLRYSIVSGNESGAFVIEPVTGLISVADSAPLDFETTPLFTLIVRVSDLNSPTPLTSDAVVVINLTNVVEEPFIAVPWPEGTYNIGRFPAFLFRDSTYTYGDVANPDYSNAQLTVSIVSGRNHRDRLVIVRQGDSEGQINVRGHRVFFSDKQIGTFRGGRGNKHPDLVVTFNNRATTAAVDALINRISFEAKTDAGTNRLVSIQVTNVDGVDSNLATRDLAVVQP